MEFVSRVSPFLEKFTQLFAMKKLIIFSLVILSSFALSAQNGFIRGSVIDDSTGEELIGVTVMVSGTSKGAVTDFDGQFNISIEPGVYNIQVSFVSFQPITITGLEVKSGGVNLVNEIRLKESVEELEAVVVTAQATRTTEAALLTVKKKSANLLDGISSASFRKIGDNDAASAAKRITGVSIEGGRYVYVRGLGDRYTKTLLNGMDVPGLDPDRNTLQMDIFPTNVLDNIIVSKSFTADLPADFTGGLVNIETKDFPEMKTMNASFGLGYNPKMHFTSNYLSYDGGSTDFLGFDDGTRSLHISDDEVLLNGHANRPTSENGMLYAEQLRGFSKTLSAMKETSFMDYNLGFSTGNQITKGENTIGYNMAITYRNTTEFYKDVQYSRYGLASDDATNELELRELQTGSQGSNNVLLGGMAGIALKRDRSKYKLNILHLQSGETRAGIFDYIGNDEGSDFVGVQHNLEYSQRQLTNFFFGGEHRITDDWKLEWKTSPTISSITDPDIRFTRYQVERGEFLIGSGEAGFPQRIWRELNEFNIASRVDLTKSYEFNGNDAKLRFGIGNTIKSRDFGIRTFLINVPPSAGDLTGNPDELFYDENLYPNQSGNYYSADFNPVNANFYESTIQNNSFYISNEFSPLKRLKAIVGVRAEDYQQLYTGRNSDRELFTDLKVVDELKFFPSANLIYSLSENQNLRFSYSRTIARFSFKEASYAAIYDPLTGRTFLGSLNPAENGQGDVIWDGNIKSTLVDNLDLRWEAFQKRGQTVSVSLFYKSFQDAIEVVQSAVADNNFQPRNIGDASVLGTEIELRQSLGLFSPKLSPFMLSTNVTILNSRIDMNKEEYESRITNAREGQKVDDFRALQGQAPYIINAGIAYDGKDDGLEIGLYYNVQGATLVYTGIADRPDIYSVPFHSLNFTANRNFGKDEKFQISLKATNILGDKQEQIYKSYKNTGNDYFQSLNPGIRFSATLRYSIF
ncbi:MAG: hypothetical protein ACI8WP_000498 [Flavobacteriaceae bacterium]